MKYTVNLDTDNFILSVANTANDNVELDLESMELDYLEAYQLINGQCFLNEERKAEIIAEREAEAKKPTAMDLLEAQVLWTALMTDSLLPEEE